MSQNKDFVREAFKDEPWEYYVKEYTDEEEENLMNGTEYYDRDLTEEEMGGKYFTYDFEPEWMEAPEIFYSSYTPVFGELLQAGLDWGRDTWTSSLMRDETIAVVRPRLNRKIEDEYYMREISIEIPAQWKKLFKRRLEDAVDKYGPVYEQIASGIDLSGIKSNKNRITSSEYPESSFNKEKGDYLTDAVTSGTKDVSSDSTLEAIRKYGSFFRHPDELVIKELDRMFSSYPYFLDSQIGNHGYDNNYFGGRLWMN